tara:strand:- start:8 stop:682 length:675 start_codon:yes stop_codon:yes gene_type:complete
MWPNLSGLDARPTRTGTGGVGEYLPASDPRSPFFYHGGVHTDGNAKISPPRGTAMKSTKPKKLEYLPASDPRSPFYYHGGGSPADIAAIKNKIIKLADEMYVLEHLAKGHKEYRRYKGDKIVKIAEHELIRNHGHQEFKEAYDRAVKEAQKIKSYESQSEEENAVDLKGIRMRDAFSKLKELEGNQASFPELMEQAMKGAKERAKLMSAEEMEMRGWRHGERWF